MSDQPIEDKLAHPCFPQPLDRSVKVWRYLDLPKLIWLLEKRKLYFSRLDLLGDSHEGSTPELNIQARNEFFRQHAPSIVAMLPESNRQLRTSVYVSCWCFGNDESEAMWRLYCPDSRGVAIQLTYQSLVDSIAHEPFLHIGCVRYIDYEKDWFPEGNVYYPVMHKRIAFSHEREVRLAKSFMENYHSGNQPAGISIEWDIEKYIEAIYVDPYAPDWYQEVVVAVTQKFSANLKQQILWSRMRADPRY
jgi:hypothetical protein